MQDLIISLIILFFGTSGLFWAVIKSSRNKPRLNIWIKGMGIHTSDNDPSKVEFFFACEVHNPNSKNNSIKAAHFMIFNRKNNESIWHSSGVKLYKPDSTTNWIGSKIGPTLKVPGNETVEFIAVQEAQAEIASQYIGNNGLFRINPKHEKPFQFKLILVDSFGNCFTGSLGQDEKTQLIDMKRLVKLSRARTDMLNDNTYGRPRFKHVKQFYWLIIKCRFLFMIKSTLYHLGIKNSTA